MNDTQQKIASCFSNVFPNIQPVALAAASTETVAGWDSVAQVTLVSSVAEEFGVDAEPEDYEELTSFAKIVTFVESKLR